MAAQSAALASIRDRIEDLGRFARESRNRAQALTVAAADDIENADNADGEAAELERIVLAAEYADMQEAFKAETSDGDARKVSAFDSLDDECNCGCAERR